MQLPNYLAEPVILFSQTSHRKVEKFSTAKIIIPIILVAIRIMLTFECFPNRLYRTPGPRNQMEHIAVLLKLSRCFLVTKLDGAFWKYSCQMKSLKHHLLQTALGKLLQYRQNIFSMFSWDLSTYSVAQLKDTMKFYFYIQNRKLSAPNNGHYVAGFSTISNIYSFPLCYL